MFEDENEDEGGAVPQNAPCAICQDGFSFGDEMASGNINP